MIIEIVQKVAEFNGMLYAHVIYDNDHHGLLMCQHTGEIIQAEVHEDKTLGRLRIPRTYKLISLSAEEAILSTLDEWDGLHSIGWSYYIGYPIVMAMTEEELWSVYIKNEE